MSYRFRNILFTFFVIIFVVLTIFFSLYATGYKISLSSLQRGGAVIQKTGILVLDSKPKGADISLLRRFRGLLFNDDVLKNKKLKTPYKIKNLLPGEYVLNLNLDGYWPWQQKINIYPGHSTYIEDIVLFKRSLPISFFSANTQDISLCLLDKKIILQDDNKLIDLKSEQEVQLGSSVNEIEFLGPSRVILNNSLLFDYDKNKYVDLPKNISPVNNKLKIKNDYLFYLEGGLKKYSFSSKKKSTVFSLDGIIDYDFYNNFYFLIREEKAEIFFQIYYYRQKELFRSIKLPLSDNYEIIPLSFNSSFVYVYDKSLRKIYIINTAFKFNSYWSVVDNVNGFNFIDANNFIYYSDSEIYMFNSILAEKFLLGRFDSKIKGLVWHPKNYIIYSNEKEIVILDLKYDKQAINLVSLEKGGNLVLDKIGSVLYFTGKIGNQEGLYKLFIQ